MNESSIPEDVLQFIEQYIDTVPHIEALLLMCETRPRPWSAADLAQRLYIDQGTAKRLLLDLERRKLVEAVVNEGAEPAYSTTDDGSGLLARVVHAYRRNLIAISRLIHSKGSPAMREFARAFQFKDK